LETVATAAANPRLVRLPSAVVLAAFLVSAEIIGSDDGERRDLLMAMASIIMYVWNLLSIDDIIVCHMLLATTRVASYRACRYVLVGWNALGHKPGAKENTPFFGVRIFID